MADVQTIAAECTTKGTEPSGKRNSCRSDLVELNAPDGYAYSKDKTVTTRDERNGSENDVWLNWYDYEQVHPEIEMDAPTRVTLQVHARSPKKDIGARGWTKVTFEIRLMKIIK